MKLHDQLGHPKGSQLINLIKSAGISYIVLLDAGKGLDDKCSICLKYKKPKSRAVVGFSLAHNFNETVAIDVKQIKNNCILHLIDHATRLALEQLFTQNTKK